MDERALTPVLPCLTLVDFGVNTVQCLIYVLSADMAVCYGSYAPSAGVSEFYAQFNHSTDKKAGIKSVRRFKNHNISFYFFRCDNDALISVRP
jgi:hypothetical protein